MVARCPFFLLVFLILLLVPLLVLFALRVARSRAGSGIGVHARHQVSAARLALMILSLPHGSWPIVL